MKTLTLIMSVLLISIFSISSEPFAQRGMRREGFGGWNAGNQYCGVYNIETVETFSGEVISIEKTTPRKGTFYGVHLIVKSGEKRMSVHLGPGWYVESQTLKIEPKDLIEVKGSVITIEGEQAVIAEEITKGEEVLKLRDENGIPLWSGWRKQSSIRPYETKGFVWMGCYGCGSRNRLCSMYAPITIEALEGKVVNIEKTTQSKGSFYGLHITVETDQETLPIRLGPGWYVEGKEFEIDPYDKVEVKGFRILDSGKEAIIATEIKKGEEILKLRDENGLPFWRGKIVR